MARRMAALLGLVLLGPSMAASTAVELASLAVLFGQVQAAIDAGRWDAARRLVEEYAAAANFNAHVGGNLAEVLVPHDPLLSTAGALLARCIAVNSLDNLAMLGPGNASARKLAMDSGRFHSAQALVYLKTGRLAQADSAMSLALAQMSDGIAPQPVDLLRAGLIDWAQGRRDRGWERVAEAILLDTAVELADPYYGQALVDVVQGRSGWGATVAGYLRAYRDENAPPVPDLLLERSPGDRFRLRERQGTALLVNFFSPLCGTCQQEIPAVRALFDSTAGRDDVLVLFLLNDPRLRDGVDGLFRRAGIRDPEVVTLAEGTAFDYIRGEPTVWIVDRGGRLTARHTGYRPGDEAAYARELAAAAAPPPRACECGRR